MDRRRAAGALLALAACIACSAAAPTANDHTALDLYDGTSEGCYYNFQHYGEGDRIMTNEPCLNCTCHNKMLMCYLRVCPFTKPIGQDCTVEKRADQCCPIVTCPDVPVDLLTSTSTTSPAEYGATGIGKLDKYGCSINGKYFSEGSKVPPTPNKPCEHCYCIRNMTTCVMQECTLHVDGCTPIYHKDVCCPVRYSCDHPEDEILLLDDMTTTVRPTPGFLLTTTTLSPVTQMTQDCVHDDQVFPDGALIKTEKACEHCYCMKGDIVCVVQECGTPMENEGKNCTSLPPREGQCCPDTYICEGDELSTESSSDLSNQEEISTLSPPRRVGVEGSGYRNEPGEALQTESSAIEIEGSGEEQSNMVQDVDVSHSISPETSTLMADEYLVTAETTKQYIPITTKSPKFDESEVVTKSPESSQDINITPEETGTDQNDPSVTVVPTLDIEQIVSTPTALVQDVDIPDEKPINGQTLMPGTISDKESSDLDQFIPFTTKAPWEDIEASTKAQDIFPNEGPEHEKNIPTTESTSNIEVSKIPSIEPYEGQVINPDDTAEVETIEPEEYSPTTTSKPKLEDNEKPTIALDVSEPEVVTENKFIEIDPHIPITQSPELEEGEMYTTETSEGHEETSNIITDTENSEPELNSVSTTKPILNKIEKESSETNIVPEAITESYGSDVDQLIPITTSLPALEDHDHQATKLSSGMTTGFVQTTDSFIPETPSTISSLQVEGDEKLSTIVSIQDKDIPDKENAEPDHSIEETTGTPSKVEDNLSTITPIVEQYSTHGVTEQEISKSQSTSTPDYKDSEKTTYGLDIKHDFSSSITTQEPTSKSEELEAIEQTTELKQITDAETTTVESDVFSVSKEESYTITTEATLRKEDTSASTDSDKPVNSESITESVDSESNLIMSSPEEQQTTKEDKINETIESSTSAIKTEDKKETDAGIAFTSPATDKLQSSETTTINIGDNEIDEDSIITSGRIPGEGDCLLNGITYRNESVIPSSNNCHIGCKCISSIIKCEPVICSPPPEYMNNCQPTYDSSESCCPTYVCDHSKETIPPESQSQMSGTESPVPFSTPSECRGDQCEIHEEQVQSCTSGDCSKEPNIKPDCSSGDCSPIQTPIHPQSVDYPENCKNGKCEPSKETCLNGDCSLTPVVEQALPVKPCESENCEEKTNESVIPQIPVVSCEGSDDCSSTSPHNVEKDVICTKENGCRKPQEESELECLGESCRRKGSSDTDGTICTGSDCTQHTPTTRPLDADTDILSTKAQDEEKYTTQKPLVADDQEAQTKLPISHVTDTVKTPEEITTEINVSHDQTQSGADDLTHETTKVSSFNDITTNLPDTTSENIEIGSQGEPQIKVTTELPQTNSMHIITTGIPEPVSDSLENDISTISDLKETEQTMTSIYADTVHTEKPQSPTEISFTPTESTHDVETDVVEPEKHEIVTQMPEDSEESSTVSIHEQDIPTKPPGSDQAIEYTEKPIAGPETSDCSSENCKPESVEHSQECNDGKCEPSKESCVNGQCHLPIENSDLPELPTSEKTEKEAENDKTESPEVMELENYTDTSLVSTNIIDDHHKTPETQTTLNVDGTEPQELVTKKPESTHTYVTEPFKDPISEFDEVSTKLQGVTETHTEILPTQSNELVTQLSDLSHMPDVETDTDATLKLEQTTKPSSHIVTTSTDHINASDIILEEQYTERPSVTKAEESFIDENLLSVTEQTHITSHVTDSSFDFTADSEQQESITDEPENPITDEIKTHPEIHDAEPEKPITDEMKTHPESHDIEKEKPVTDTIEKHPEGHDNEQEKPITDEVETHPESHDTVPEKPITDKTEQIPETHETETEKPTTDSIETHPQSDDTEPEKPITDKTETLPETHETESEKPGINEIETHPESHDIETETPITDKTETLPESHETEPEKPGINEIETHPESHDTEPETPITDKTETLPESHETEPEKPGINEIETHPESHDTEPEKPITEKIEKLPESHETEPEKPITGDIETHPESHDTEPEKPTTDEFETHPEIHDTKTEEPFTDKIETHPVSHETESETPTTDEFVTHPESHDTKIEEPVTDKIEKHPESHETEPEKPSTDEFVTHPESHETEPEKPSTDEFVTHPESHDTKTEQHVTDKIEMHPESHESEPEKPTTDEFVTPPETHDTKTEEPITDKIETQPESHVTEPEKPITNEIETQPESHDTEPEKQITDEIKSHPEGHETKPEEPFIDETETHPESHETKPEKPTTDEIKAHPEGHDMDTQEKLSTLETFDITEQKTTTESIISISDDQEISEPPKDTDTSILIDHTGLPDSELLTESPEAMRTEEPKQTLDTSDTEVSNDDNIKTESPKQQDDQVKLTTEASIGPHIDNKIPESPVEFEKEEHTTEIPVYSVTEPQETYTKIMEPIITEKEQQEIDTATSKPLILDNASQTEQHESIPEISTIPAVKVPDESTKVPVISPEQPISSQTTESYTSEPLEKSTEKEFITPSAELTSVNYPQEVITEKAPEIATESSEPYIPVHQEHLSTETPAIQESGTEQYDITRNPDEIVKESSTDISHVDFTKSQDPVSEELITEVPKLVTESAIATDDKLEKTTDTTQSPITEFQITEVSHEIRTETPLSLVTVAEDTTKKTDKATDSIDLSTEVPAIISPQEHITEDQEIITKSPGIFETEDNEIQPETIPQKEKEESSTKSVKLPDSEPEIFTTESFSHEVVTKVPEIIVTESQTLGSTEKAIESTTFKEEQPVIHPALTNTDLSSVVTEDELLKLSTDSSIPLVTEVAQITTKVSETQVPTELQGITTEATENAEPENQGSNSESAITVATVTDGSITEKNDLITEQETVTDHLDATEKSETMQSKPHETQELAETSSKSPLSDEGLITTSDEAQLTTAPKYESSESTPYLIELEEHTHKLEEEQATTSRTDEEYTTGKDIEQKQKDSEITTKKSTDEDISSETDEKLVQKDETISTISSLRPADEQTTQSVPIEEMASSSDLPVTQDKQYGTPVMTESTSSAPSIIAMDLTTPTMQVDISVSPMQEIKPTEQTEEEKVTISEKPDKPDMPLVTSSLDEVPKTTTAKIEDATTQTPAPIEKYTKTEEKPSVTIPSTAVPELSKPESNEIQPTDEVPSPEDGGHVAPSGTSGYGPEPDYFEEDQTFGPGTCRYGGKVYVSAQQIPRDDPCDFCFCFRSDIICLQQSCPPPIHGCHEEPIQGFCCPRYECPVSMATTLNVTTTTTTTTTTLPPHFPTHPYKGAAQRKGCQIKGHTYKVGEVVRASSGPCLHCTCGGDGQMKCDPKACTPEPMLRQMIAAAVSAKRRR